MKARNMITIFIAVDPISREKFENGKMTEKAFTEKLAKSTRLPLRQIDRAISVMAQGDEDSPYWDLFGGDLLAGEGGKTLVADPNILAKGEGGPFETCDPAVFQTSDEADMVSAFLENIDEETFRRQFDERIKKLTRWRLFSRRKKELKENADEIFGIFWAEMDALKSFYKNRPDGSSVVLATFYEEEDFEMTD